MSTNVIASGRLATQSTAMIVCSSSDFPAPVVPATRPCGPSADRSRMNGPSALTPIGILVVRPRFFQAISTRSGCGSGMWIRSSSRAESGIMESESSRLTSRTGASARATRSAQPTETWSASMAGPPCPNGPP